jgi:hypothetical protein
MLVLSRSRIIVRSKSGTIRSAFDALDQARSRGKVTSCRFVELAIVAA